MENNTCPKCAKHQQQLMEKFGAFSIAAAVWKPRYCRGKNCPSLPGVS